MYSIVFTSHILPLAYDVIDSENDAAWTWFFEQFKIAYGDRETCASFQIEMRVVPSTEYLHMVNNGGRHYTVCLLERKCVCRRFQVDELPCPHAWAVLKGKFLMLEEYWSNYYKPNSVVMTYDVPVYLLPDINDWNIPTYVAEEVVLPPKWKRPPGRPKKKRNKPLSELLQPENQHSCSICRQGGHNKRTCRNAPRRI
ncbi:uncharacterized protein [Nicotiana sylvestris]|uniref:uncharacterized protein n=1 Tax=Nicotiana sylvestris TaxID=4096 RepID=UPI00388CB8BA